MSKHTSGKVRRAALHDWQHFTDEQKAERGGMKADSRPVEHTLKVEQFSYAFGAEHPIHSLIRLKGRWLATIFPPNTRVVVEKGDDCLILRKSA